MLFLTPSRRNDLMAGALDWDLESFSRIMWKKLAIFCGRVQWPEVWLCCNSVVLDFTEVTVEAREECGMEIAWEIDCWGGGREWARNEQCRSLYGKLFDWPLPLNSLTQVVTEYGFDVVCPQLNANSWGKINLIFSAYFWSYLENSWFNVFFILFLEGHLSLPGKNNFCPFAIGLLFLKSL